MRRSSCFAVFLLTASAFLCGAYQASGAEKVRDWQMGKVLDSERSRYFAGTVGDANTTGHAQANGNYGSYHGHTNTSETAIYRTYQTFLIEGETHAYLAEQRLRWHRAGANLTVNGPVKFAVEGRKLFVIDEDGKEYETKIVKRILRTPAEQPSNRQNQR